MLLYFLRHLLLRGFALNRLGRRQVSPVAPWRPGAFWSSRPLLRLPLTEICSCFTFMIGTQSVLPFIIHLVPRLHLRYIGKRCGIEQLPLCILPICELRQMRPISLCHRNLHLFLLLRSHLATIPSPQRHVHHRKDALLILCFFCALALSLFKVLANPRRILPRSFFFHLELY